MTNFPEKQVVCYKTVDGIELSADVYVPQNAAKPMPLFFYIHGGGWLGGSADEPLRVCSVLLEKLFADGAALVTIRYRFADGDRDYHEPITDSIDALHYFYDHADDFGFDRSCIFVGGASAGGHLSLTTAFAQSVFASDKLHAAVPMKAVVDLCGPVDFTNHGPVRSEKESSYLLRNFLGGTDDELDARAIEASPITYVRAFPAEQLMPIIAVHGSLDELVNCGQPLILRDAYAEAGAPFELVSVENGRHSFGAVEGYPPPSITHEEIQEKVYEFLKKYVLNNR